MESIYSSKSTYGWQLRLDYTVSQSTADNASTLALSLYLWDGTGESWNEAAQSCYYTLQGARTYNPYHYTDAQKNTWIALGTKQVTVSHAADGTGSVTLSADWHSGFTSAYTPEELSLSRAVSLPAIPRASTMTVPAEMTMGRSYTFPITAASSSFTHTVRWAFGSLSGTLSGNSWKPAPATLGPQIPTALSGTVTLTLETYSGGTKVGSRSYEARLRLPDYTPSASLTVTPESDNAAVASWDVAVQGFSRLRYTLSGSSSYGASVTAREMRCQGQVYTAASGVTDVLGGVDGALAFRVRDSRGVWSAGGEKTVTVYPYGVPAFTESSAVRCRADGTADENGGYLKVRAAASVSPVGGRNALTLRARWRAASGGGWSDYTALTAGQDAVLETGLSPRESCRVELTASDGAGSARTVEHLVPTAAVALHLRAGGQGAAFGKYAEHDRALELAEDWTLRLHGAPVADFVTALGTDGTWTWRKWQSGLAECWGKAENLTVTSGAAQLDWPESNGLFTAIDAVQATAWYGADASTRAARTLLLTASTNTDRCTLYLRAADGGLPPSGAVFAASLHALGRWR